MNILLEDTNEAILNVMPLINKSQINKNTRLFYAHGTYTRSEDNMWVRSSWKHYGLANYIEIKDPLNFKKYDNKLNNTEYIKHHGFVISAKN